MTHGPSTRQVIRGAEAGGTAPTPEAKEAAEANSGAVANGTVSSGIGTINGAAVMEAIGAAATEAMETTTGSDGHTHCKRRTGKMSTNPANTMEILQSGSSGK